MATLRWVVICERAITDQQSNTLSLITIIEEVSIPKPPPEVLAGDQKPIIPHRFTVVQLWNRTKADVPEKVIGRTRFFTPSGKQYGGSEYLVDLSLYTAMRGVTQSPGFPLEGAGDYSVQTQVKTGTRWRTLNVEKFRVKFIDPPTPPTTH